MKKRNGEKVKKIFRLRLRCFAFSFLPLFTFLTALLLMNTACRQSPPNITAEQTKNQKTMEFHLNHAVFEVPPTLQDITLYSFGKPDKSQLVEVNGSEREVSLDKLSEEITDQATDGLGLKLENTRDTKIDDMPARILTFTGEERGATFRQFFVLAIVPPSAESRLKHLEIKYLTKENAETANAKLETMVKSVRRISKAPTIESSDGYTRRFAGAVSLDIPTDLLGGGFQFTLRDDSPAITDESVTFEVSEVLKSNDKSPNQANINQKDEKNGDEAEMESDINTDLNSGGQILEKATKDLSNAQFKGKVLSYAVNNAPPWEKQPVNKLVRRAYLQISNDVEVRIVGHADSRKREILEQNFNQILNSVKKK
jgi:hypothetical protein